MAKIITFSIQKGGSAKTTSTGITAYLLSLNYKVLVIDFDSQGNITEMLTQKDIYDFQNKTIFEAIKSNDPHKFIHKITDNLDIMTAEDHLATFSRWLYSEYKGNRSLALAKILAEVEDKYDYILIDTPPALGDQTINALAASDGVVAMFETSKFCYSALDRFMETIEHVKKLVNPEIKTLGILCSMIDNRRSDNKEYIEIVKEDYPGLCFDTIIHRKAATGRIAIYGIVDNPELNNATDQYKPFVKELLERVAKG